MNKLGLVSIESSLLEQQIVDEILACNLETEKYGLTLNQYQAVLLTQTRSLALKESQRIELNGEIIVLLIEAFCDSPYVSQENDEDTLHELIELFYDLKNSTWDLVSDNDLIAFMKDSFNGFCYGSFELLYGEALRLSEHIHGGKSIQTFRSGED